MEDRKTGHRIEARRRHIEVFTDADHVRVRVVSVNYRVCVSAIAIVGRPDFRDETLSDDLRAQR